MSYAVIHLTKLKGARLKNMLAHSRRSRNVSQNRDNIDAARSGRNIEMYAAPAFGTKGGGGYGEICDFIKSKGVTRKIGKNQVVLVEAVMSASPDFFETHNVADWMAANAAWLHTKYGDNLVEVHLHRDEKTPHLHAYFVPVTDDAKLNSAQYCTSRQLLRKLQSEYPQAMQSAGFDLRRGVESGGAKRTTEAEYLRQAALGVASAGKPPTKTIVKKTGVLGLKEQKKRVLDAPKMAAVIKAQAGEIKVLRGKNEQLKKHNAKLKAELKKWRPGQPVTAAQVARDWRRATGQIVPVPNNIDAIMLFQALLEYTENQAILAVIENYGKARAVATIVAAAHKAGPNQIVRAQVTAGDFTPLNFEQLAQSRQEEKESPTKLAPGSDPEQRGGLAPALTPAPGPKM